LPGGRIIYYELFIDDGNFGDFILASSYKSIISQYTVSNLSEGLVYRFKVIAHNFN